MSQPITLVITVPLVVVFGLILLATLVKLCCCTLPSAVCSCVDNYKKKNRRKAGVEGEYSSANTLLSVKVSDSHQLEPSAPPFCVDEHQPYQANYCDTIDANEQPPAYSSLAANRTSVKTVQRHYRVVEHNSCSEQPPRYSSLHLNTLEVPAGIHYTYTNHS